MGAKQFISPTTQGFVLCNGAKLVDGAVHVPSELRGWALYGPRMKIQSGVYSVKLLLRVPDGVVISGMWDVFNLGRVLGRKRLDEACEMLVRIVDCVALELRVFTEGGQFFCVEGFTLEAAVTDDEMPADPKDANALVQLANRLIVDQGGADMFFSALALMAKFGLVEEAEKLRSEFVINRAAAGSAALYAFHDVHEPISTGVPLHRAYNEPSHEEVVAFTSRMAFKKIDLCRDVDWERESERATHRLVEMSGYKYDLLNATRLYRSYKTMPPSVDPAPTSSGFLNHLRSVDIEFQHDLLKGNGIAAYCPISGRHLLSRHGFVQYFAGVAFVLYRFEGVETFYICQTEWSGARLFMYFPKTNIIFQTDQYSRWYSDEEIICGLNANMILSSQAVARYLHSETRPAAVMGINNLGHFFWNDLGGFERVVEAGESRLLSAVITVGREFINMSDLFPEISEKKIRCISDEAEAFNFFLSENYLPIRFSAASISDRFGRRVERTAADRASPRGKPPTDRPRPLVWINLRAHNKSWASQVEGFPHIFDGIYGQFGAASVLLDGTADCLEIAEQIRARTRPEVVFYEGLGLDLMDSLNWAFHVDAYIATVGSGLVLVNWLAGKQGVAHANLGHMEQLSWWGDVRPSVPQPYAVPLSEIVDDGGLYGNYDLDWRSLLRLLLQALKSAGF